MKKLTALLTALLILAVLVLPVSAVPLRLVDDADLLTPEEYSVLLDELDAVSLAYGADVVIYTLPSLEGHDITVWADTVYDAEGYGQGDDYAGILFVISMAEREWAISTCGEAIDIFTDSRQENMTNAMLGDLSAGHYAAAFHTFAGYCADLLEAGVPTYEEDDFTYIGFGELETGEVISPGFSSERGLSPLEAIFFSLVIGLIVALIYTSILKGQLKSVAPAKNAANYTRDGSFNLTQSNEVFLYKNLSRVRRQQNTGSSGTSRSGSSRSSTHRSSSGRSHGGSRGRF